MTPDTEVADLLMEEPEMLILEQNPEIQQEQFEQIPQITAKG